MAQQQISPGSINAAIAALRFFFTVTLERPDLVRPLRIVTEPRQAPVVLSQEEVARLLEAAPGLKYKAALSVAYGAGLRVSEVANLKVSDIDSQRMTLRVEQGKGQRDRYVMLSPQLLELLREWWQAARPQVWLFPGQNPINPMTARQLNRAVTAAKDSGGNLQARIAAHLAAQLRYASARTGRRHPRDPGVARNGYIVPTNSRLMRVSATGSIRASAKWCRSGDGSKAAASSSSSFFNRTARSPACRHG